MIQIIITETFGSEGQYSLEGLELELENTSNTLSEGWVCYKQSAFYQIRELKVILAQCKGVNSNRKSLAKKIWQLILCTNIKKTKEKTLKSQILHDFGYPHFYQKIK